MVHLLNWMWGYLQDSLYVTTKSEGAVQMIYNWVSEIP
jgi:hypothetical protein